MDSFYGDLGNDDTHEGDISDVDISEVEDVLGAVGGFSTNLFSSIQKNKPESSSQTRLDASSVKTTQQGSGDSAVKIVKPQVSESPKKLSFSNKKLFSTDFDEADPLGDLLSDEESSPPKKASVKHEDLTIELEKSEEKTNNSAGRNNKSGIISKLFGFDKKAIKPDSSTDDVSLSAEKSPFKQINVSAGNTKGHSVNSSVDTSVVKDKSQILNVHSLKDDKLGKPASDSSLFGLQLSKESKLSKPISDSSLLINQNSSPNRKVLPDDDENINDLLEDNSKEVLSKVVKNVQSAQKWTEKQKSSAGASSYVPSVVTTRESRRSVVKKNISDIFDPLGIVSTAQPTVDKNSDNSAASKKIEVSTLDSSVSVDMPHKQIDSDMKKPGQSADVYSPMPSEQLSRNLSKSDWLGISDNSFNDVLDDNIVKHSPSHSSRRALAIAANQSKHTPSAVISPSRNATSPDKAHHSKMKTDNENAVNLPEWLGGKPESSPVKKKTPVEQKHAPSTSTNVDAKQLSESETDVQRVLSNFTDVLQTGKHFDEAAVSFLQHQDIQLLVALHLKQREKEMASLNSHQQDILLRQENLLQQLIDKQLTRQKVMEEKFKEQQDRINHYVQALMDQTQEEPLQRLSTSAYIEKHDNNKEVQEQTHARYEDEMQTMRSTYAHQISLLQEALERQEKRLKHEISQLEGEHRATVLKMQEERKILEEEYQKKIKLLQEEKLLDIQHVKEFYHKELESLRSYYMKTVDDIHKSSAQNRYMTMLNEKLDESTSQLNQLQEKIQKSSESYHDLKENVLKSNKSELREFSQKLDIQSKIYEQKHQNLVKLISQLEERILKQRSEIDAKNLKLQQETLKFETRVREFELEKQKLQQNRKEDLQNTPEKHSHNTPTGNMKVKHNKEISETSTHYNNTQPNLQPGINDADKIRKEAEMAIQTTQQAFEQVRLEKGKLAEGHKQIIQEQRRLKEYEKRLTKKAQELDVLTQVAVSTKKQGLHALEEAKYIELKQNIQITDIHRQLSELKEREVKLGKDKAELMHEKDMIEKMKKTRYCELCKTLLKHSKNQQQQSSSLSLSQMSGNKTANIVDPEYIILKYSAEKDIEQSLIQSILPSR